MNYLPENLKFLRQANNYTQQQLSKELDLKRSVIGAYEEGRATPKIPTLQKLASFFNVSLDQLIGVNLKKGIPTKAQELAADSRLQILPIVVDGANEERIPIIPVKAAAGYLNGYADPEFIGEMPSFNMPVPELAPGRTYRVFQIKGDSMLPVMPGAYVFCEFVESMRDIRDGESYILVTKDDGLVYKRIYVKANNQLLLHSDNQEYEAYQLPLESVLEVWKADGVLSFNLPKPNQLEVSRLSDILEDMRDEIRQLRKH